MTCSALASGPSGAFSACGLPTLCLLESSTCQNSSHSRSDIRWLESRFLTSIGLDLTLLGLSGRLRGLNRSGRDGRVLADISGNADESRSSWHPETSKRNL